MLVAERQSGSQTPRGRHSHLHTAFWCESGNSRAGRRGPSLKDGTLFTTFTPPAATTLTTSRVLSSGVGVLQLGTLRSGRPAWATSWRREVRGSERRAGSWQVAHGRSRIRAFGGKAGAPPRTLKAQGGRGHTTLPYFEWAHHLGSMMLFRNSPRGARERETRPWQDHATLPVGSRPTHAVPGPAWGAHPCTARR